MALLRSGWLWRQTSVLKRWKLNWCDLWIDGSLCFYKNESRRDLEHRVSLKTRCVDVRSGLECGGASPPESNPRENLIVVQLSNGSTVNLCANSEDESILLCFFQSVETDSARHQEKPSVSIRPIRRLLRSYPHQQLPHGLHHTWSRTRDAPGSGSEGPVRRGDGAHGSGFTGWDGSRDGHEVLPLHALLLLLK
ncbi:pleckstrin homology domain-containing family B member 1 isoform X1 [Trematomus bernacchii]|uniref:pleckstrin homology domain-containing family B member 1 isoform X1 n=1 Tax=Trematomus bernacchii TaxID=40690 RepID=UPI00146BFC70|nr:pleckstrin homology domain-containing family B member 1 isoform X1 [Trematomus bernacchii]